MEVNRGDIFYADLSPVVGSEQGGIRPVLVVQNNVGNKYSPTVIVSAITSKLSKAKLPTHIELDRTQCNLSKDSVVLLIFIMIAHHVLSSQVTVICLHEFARQENIIYALATNLCIH